MHTIILRSLALFDSTAIGFLMIRYLMNSSLEEQRQSKFKYSFAITMILMLVLDHITLS